MWHERPKLKISDHLKVCANAKPSHLEYLVGTSSYCGSKDAFIPCITIFLPTRPGSWPFVQDQCALIRVLSPALSCMRLKICAVVVKKIWFDQPAALWTHVGQNVNVLFNRVYFVCAAQFVANDTETNSNPPRDTL